MPVSTSRREGAVVATLTSPPCAGPRTTSTGGSPRTSGTPGNHHLLLHHGTASLVRLLLADVHAAAGRTGEERRALREVRQAPGPYRGLVVHLVDRRLQHLA